jgi:hypothetical protein
MLEQILDEKFGLFCIINEERIELIYSSKDYNEVVELKEIIETLKSTTQTKLVTSCFKMLMGKFSDANLESVVDMGNEISSFEIYYLTKDAKNVNEIYREEKNKKDNASTKDISGIRISAAVEHKADDDELFYYFEIPNGKSFKIPIREIAKKKVSLEWECNSCLRRHGGSFFKNVEELLCSYKQDILRAYKDIVALEWDEIKDIAIEIQVKEFDMKQAWEQEKKAIVRKYFR